MERVALARSAAFVGRGDELAAFQHALDTGGGLLYVHGPGGTGKTLLLQQFAWLAEKAGRGVSRVDGRDLGLGTPGPAALLAGQQPTVLLVDTAERLPPVDRWLGEDAITGDALIVVASIDPAPLQWRVDPGWRAVVRSLPLANFSDAEAAAFLTEQEVPADEHEAAIAFTRGHPLALALLVDARSRHGARPDPASPDVVTSLLDVLLSNVPGPLHRAALEASALARVTNCGGGPPCSTGASSTGATRRPGAASWPTASSCIGTIQSSVACSARHRSRSGPCGRRTGTPSWPGWPGMKVRPRPRSPGTGCTGSRRQQPPLWMVSGRWATCNRAG